MSDDGSQAVSRRSAWGIVGTLAAWVAGSLAIACLVAPAVHSGLLVVIDGFTVPYSRVFNRVALLIALAMLWLLRGGLDFPLVAHAWRRESWARRSGLAAIGFFAAAVLALLVLPLIVAGGEVRWSPAPLSTNVLRMLRAIPGAIVASGIEEAFFRVIVFGGLALRASTAFAAVVSSVFYAAIHFLAPRHDFAYPGWSPLVGFEYFAGVLEAFVRPELLPGLAGLFVVGIALCLVYGRHGSFALCVGLHAGWFVAAKAGVHLLQIAPGAATAAVAGKRMFLVGHPWTWAAVGLAAFAVSVTVSRRRSTN
jgi:uncharacterized protein